MKGFEESQDRKNNKFLHVSLFYRKPLKVSMYFNRKESKTEQADERLEETS
jgi:hypothetical protein